MTTDLEIDWGDDKPDQVDIDDMVKVIQNKAKEKKAFKLDNVKANMAIWLRNNLENVHIEFISSDSESDITMIIGPDRKTVLFKMAEKNWF